MTSMKLSLNEVLDVLNKDEDFFDDAQEVIQEGSDEEFDAEEVEDSDAKNTIPRRLRTWRITTLMIYRNFNSVCYNDN